MDGHGTLDLVTSLLSPVRYRGLRVLCQVREGLIEKLVGDQKRFVVQDLNAPIGTAFGVLFFEDVARNTIFIAARDSLISSVSFTILFLLI